MCPPQKFFRLWRPLPNAMRSRPNARSPRSRRPLARAVLASGTVSDSFISVTHLMQDSALRGARALRCDDGGCWVTGWRWLHVLQSVCPVVVPRRARVERTIIKLGSASNAVRSGASRFPLKRDWWRLKGYDAFYGVYSRRAATWIHISDSRPKSRRRTHVQVRRPTCIMDTDTRRLNE